MLSFSNTRRQGAVFSLAGLLVSASLQAFTAEQEAWLNGDDEALIESVNEGELVFLAELPDEPPHYHSNHIVLSSDSLESGWASILQCHQQLDVTGRVEIVFHSQRTRNLKITSMDGIRGAWVENNTVQLNEVLPAASLCIELQSQIVHQDEDGGISVRNGPYMRRFLDGYYPMHVHMKVEYPCDKLRLQSTHPEPQAGFSVTESDCEVLVDAWFEGSLHTDLRFTRLEAE